ncbi:MAG: sulfotransferase [Bacteroidetes bacterium]|nr:sulfotransferase [Bacteroidota bacterium]
MEKHAPNFFVIGVAKAGTTSLYRYLRQHPDVYVSPIKEPNHYSLPDINESLLDPRYKRDIQINLQHYIRRGMNESVHIAHVADATHYAQLFSKVTEEKAIGDFSNSYFGSKTALHSIAKNHPSAKIIVVLRNPLTRAWSHYLMNRREGKAPNTNFLEEVLSDNAKPHKGWGINHQYLSQGLYSKGIELAMQYFDNNNLKVVLYEEFKANPNSTLCDICNYLSVNTHFKFNTRKQANSARMPRNNAINQLLVNSGILSTLKRVTPREFRAVGTKVLYSSSTMPNMREDEKSFLRDYYRKDVESLSNILSLNLNKYWNI